MTKGELVVDDRSVRKTAHIFSHHGKYIGRECDFMVCGARIWGNAREPKRGDPPCKRCLKSDSLGLDVCPTCHGRGMIKK